MKTKNIIIWSAIIFLTLVYLILHSVSVTQNFKSLLLILISLNVSIVFLRLYRYNACKKFIICLGVSFLSFLLFTFLYISNFPNKKHVIISSMDSTIITRHLFIDTQHGNITEFPVFPYIIGNIIPEREMLNLSVKFGILICRSHLAFDIMGYDKKYIENSFDTLRFNDNFACRKNRFDLYSDNLSSVCFLQFLQTFGFYSNIVHTYISTYNKSLDLINPSIILSDSLEKLNQIITAPNKFVSFHGAAFNIQFGNSVMFDRLIHSVQGAKYLDEKNTTLAKKMVPIIFLSPSNQHYSSIAELLPIVNELFSINNHSFIIGYSGGTYACNYFNEFHGDSIRHIIMGAPSAIGFLIYPKTTIDVIYGDNDSLVPARDVEYVQFRVNSEKIKFFKMNDNHFVLFNQNNYLDYLHTPVK